MTPFFTTFCFSTIYTYPSATPTAHVSTSAHAASTAPSSSWPTAATSAHVHVLFAHGLLHVHMLAVDLMFALK